MTCRHVTKRNFLGVKMSRLRSEVQCACFRLCFLLSGCGCPYRTVGNSSLCWGQAKRMLPIRISLDLQSTSIPDTQICLFLRIMEELALFKNVLIHRKANIR